MKKALIVGMGECVDAAIGAPRHAVADSAALAEMLGDDCGFEVAHLLESPSREELLDAAADMAGSLGPHDSFLLAFFGRGFVTRHGDLSLVCADDHLDALQSGEGGVPFHVLETITRRGGVNRAFLVAASAPDWDGGGGRFGLYGKIHEVDFPEGDEARVILCQSERLPADSDCIGKEHGVFAEALLGILRGSGPAPLDIDEAIVDAFASRMGEACESNGLAQIAPMFRLYGAPFPLVGDAGADRRAREEAERLARAAARADAEELRTARELLVRTLAARERGLALNTFQESTPYSLGPAVKQSPLQPDSPDKLLHPWEWEPQASAPPQNVPEPEEPAAGSEIRGWSPSTSALLIWGVDIALFLVVADRERILIGEFWGAFLIVAWTFGLVREMVVWNTPKKDANTGCLSAFFLTIGLLAMIVLFGQLGQ